MSLFVKLFNGGEKTKKKPCQQDPMEKLSDVEMLKRKQETLKEKIEQELVFVRKNSRNNRRVALQALRRKRWYEKHLKCIDCAVKAMRFAHEHTDIANKLKDLIKGIREEQDWAEDMLRNLDTSLSSGVEFDEDELQAELERLEKNLDESLFEKGRDGERDLYPKLPFTASSQHHAQTEEDEIEADLEYLRRWVNEQL